jgi:hypothetical protein
MKVPADEESAALSCRYPMNTLKGDTGNKIRLATRLEMVPDRFSYFFNMVGVHAASACGAIATATNL